MVRTTVRDLLLNHEAVVEHLRLWVARMTADPTVDDRLNQTKARLHELNRQRVRLVDAYQSADLDLEEVQSRKAAVGDRIVAVEQERAELCALETRWELASRQVVSVEAIVAELRTRLAEADYKMKEAILRLVVEKVVVTGYRLEIHLALPVSGSSDLSLVRGAKPRVFKLVALW